MSPKAEINRMCPPSNAAAAPSPALGLDAALFDLGKVVLDWDPRYYYARFFDGDSGQKNEALERFVGTAITTAWIHEMDAGKPIAQAVAERQRAFPQYAALLARWSEGWPLMLKGEIEGTVALLRELRERGLRLYALTNFSAENYPLAQARCPSLALFEDVVVSAEIGLIKPDPRIYAYAIERCRLEASRTVFVDDLEANVAAASAAGLHALIFSSPAQLRADLAPLLVP
jgi:2-haloacid dehalogenase